MANSFWSVLGSGTSPYMNPILHTSLGGTFNGNLSDGPTEGHGVRAGAQVLIANPEDLVSSPSFMVSGITVGNTPIEIWAPDVNEPNFRRRRKICIQNLGTGDLYISHSSDVGTSVTQPGWKVNNPDAGAGVTNESTTLELPFMGGASVWAVSNTSADVRVLVY